MAFVSDYGKEVLWFRAHTHSELTIVMPPQYV